MKMYFVNKIRVLRVVLVFMIIALFCSNVVAQYDVNNENIDTRQNNVINTTEAPINIKNDDVIFIKRVETATAKTGIAHLYETITKPIYKFISSSKVTSVIRNIGVCAVNGFMELISFYLPAPMIPLIATVAGLVIPFEPIVMLKHKMPVTSYRRAFQTAVNGFLKTFDKYKVDADYDDDPYMTRRFNRRFMNVPNDRDKLFQKEDTQNKTYIIHSKTNNEEAPTNCTNAKEKVKRTLSIIREKLIGPLIQFLEATKLCKLFNSIWACTLQALADLINENIPLTPEGEEPCRTFVDKTK